MEKLLGGLEAGIEGGIHQMPLLCAQNSKEEDWGFLLIDARNAFNEENRTAMLKAVWHECPSGTQLTFNCYHHWFTLVVLDMKGSGTFFYSKEVVTQGEPLAMISCGIGVLPLIRELRDAHPCVTQPCCADEAGESGIFGNILAHFRDL